MKGKEKYFIMKIHHTSYIYLTNLHTFILIHFSNSGSDVTQRVIRVAGQYRTPNIMSIDFPKYFVYVCWDSSKDLKPLVES